VLTLGGARTEVLCCSGLPDLHRSGPDLHRMSRAGRPMRVAASGRGLGRARPPGRRTRSTRHGTRPPSLVSKAIWKQRFEDIAAHERYLSRNGVVIRKFFLHVSKEEQRRRFLSRIDEAEKNWKFSLADAKERRRWDDYQSAYEEMIRHTSTSYAPWYVVPADHKWFTRLAVAEVVIQTLEGLGLAFPVVDDAKKKELLAARQQLERDGKGN
jgi:hypothetical protein